jgi:drug/metabolite transporter (DMT)-like permease
VAVAYVLATVWLWSLIPLAVKVADDSFSGGFIGFVRLLFGMCFFAVWELTTRRSLRLPAAAPGPRGVGPRLWIIVAGLGIGGDLVLYAVGLRYTTASAATLIVSTDGIMLALLGVVVLRERRSGLKTAAGLAALTGLVLVGWSGQSVVGLLASKHSLGNVIVLLAGCCWATYGLGQRVLAGAAGGSLFWIFLVGAAMGATVAFSAPITHAPITAKAVGALLYLGLGGTGLAYVLLVRGMARLEAATVGVVSSTLPIFTMIQAHYWLGEAITPYLLAGAVLVMAGVTLILRHQRVYGE